MTLWMLKKKVPEFKIQKRRDYCCAQEFDLRDAGNSDPTKGPTHYCPGCGFAFWLREVKPTAEQVTEWNKYRKEKVTMAQLSYRQYMKTPAGVWGATEKTKMIDQLGGEHQPQWMHEPEKKYWRDLYCDKYPNSRLGKLRTQKRLEEKDRNKHGR